MAVTPQRQASCSGCAQMEMTPGQVVFGVWIREGHCTEPLQGLLMAGGGDGGYYQVHPSRYMFKEEYSMPAARGQPREEHLVWRIYLDAPVLCILVGVWRPDISTGLNRDRLSAKSSGTNDSGNGKKAKL